MIKLGSSMVMKHASFFLAMLLLMPVKPGNCRSIAVDSSSSGLVSDGVGQGEVKQPVFVVFKQWVSSDGCQQIYGFMPCATTALGNIFLILVYVSLMFFAAKLLYDGSEILVEVLSPGIHGGVFLPLLSSFLDAVINIASRQCGNKETAKNHASIEISLLTGSTALLLTLLGGSCIIVGRCDLENSRAKASEEDVRAFSLAGSAVCIDIRARYTARIMLISITPFLIVHLSQVVNTTSQICLAVFISLIISISLLLAYCLQQVFHPSILKARLAYAIMSRIIKHLKCCSVERLLTAKGEADIEVIRKLFAMIGENSDHLHLASELRALIKGIQIKEKDSDIDDAVVEVMREFDACGDSKINMDGFIRGISNWLNKAEHSGVCTRDSNSQTRIVIDDSYMPTNEEHELLGIHNDEVLQLENHKWSISKAILMLLLGSLITATFSNPLINSVSNFSTATNIPTFFVSFVVLPFAGSSEAVSDLIFSSQKKLRFASLTFSKIYEAVSMNNLLCLSFFSGLIYFQQLTWNFTSEVLILLIIWSFLPKEYVTYHVLS